MEQNVDWWDNATALLEDAGLYRRLVGKLIFLTVTRPDIAYAVSVLSQFMQAPRTIHLEGVYRVLSYLKRAPGRASCIGDRIIYTLRPTLTLGSLVTRRIGSHMVDMPPMLEVTWSHGALRSSLSCPALVPKPSIEPWRIPRQKCCGYALFSPSLASCQNDLCRCTAITWCYLYRQ